MSYGIVRVQKFSAGSVKGIEIHDCREKADEQISHTNKDIDWSRTAQNYDLAPEHNQNFGRAVKKRIGQLQLIKAVRKDAVVMAQVLVTSDSSFFGGLTADQQKQFFKDSYDFLAARYGADNVISATVHLDERTPHMHFNFVPVTEDGRLSAKSILTRASLIEQQTAFAAAVGKKYGLERGEPEGSNKRRVHLQTEEYKEQTAAENYAREKAVEARARLLEVSKQVDAAERQFAAYKGVQGKIEAIEAIQPKRVVGNVVVKPNEFAVLQEQAKAYAANSPELEQLHQLQQQLHDRQREADEREQQLRDRDRELDEREQQLHKAEIRQADLNGILTQTEEQLQKTQARRVQLFAENKALQQQLEIAVSDVDRLQQQQRHFVTVERCYEATAQLCAKLIGRASPLYQPELTPDAHTMLVQAAAIHDEISGQPVGKTLVESPRQPFPDKTFCSPEQYRQECARQQAEAEEREAERSHRRSGFDMER